MKMTLSDNFNASDYIDKLMNLDMALERLDGLFDMISPAMFDNELTATEYLRLMGFRDFTVPESIQRLGHKKMTDRLSSMAGNSMVVECLMALFLQMDITKYGIDNEE